MGSVLNRGGNWVVEWKDATGRYRQKRTKCRTKAEARRMVEDLDRQAERQRMGLEPPPGDRKLITFGELMDWWWERHGANLRSPTIRPFLEKHFRGRLGHVPLPQVTPEVFDKLLADLQGDLSPASLNHLRALAFRMFRLAARPGAGLWSGHNPISDVPRRKVPKRHPEYLRWEEVPAVLSELAVPWR
jgi:integrase